MHSHVGREAIRDVDSHFIALSLVASALVDGNGRLVEANPAFHELTGLRDPPEAPALGDLVGEAERPRLFANLLAALAGRRSEAQFLINRRRLAPRLVTIASGPAPGPAPRILVQVMPAGLDEPAHDELLRLQLALDGAGQGIWDHDLNRGTVYYSPTWYRMRGFEPGADIDGELGPWMDRLHPEDRPRIAEIARRQNSGELPANAFEYRERHRSGQWIWVLSRGKPVAWNSDGTVARTLGTDTDITALKTAELQLTSEKERLRITLHSIADGMISTDPDGRVTFLNPAGEQYTGWNVGEATGRPVSDILMLRSAGSLLDLTALRRTSAAGRLNLDGDAQLVDRWGAGIDVSLTLSPITGPDGPQGYVFVFQDVTHSRAMRRRLAHGATHDQLTDLPNRVLFEQTLEEAIEDARLQLHEHALCYIDLDRFKAVNDGAGHAAGDEVLRRVAGLLLKSCRSRDFAARVGGDEFVLILRDCSVRDAERVCEKLIDTLRAADFSFEGRRYPVGASIGIAPIRADQQSPAALTGEADVACYQSKAAGRGRVTLCRTA